MLSVSRQTINSIETSRYVPSLPHIQATAIAGTAVIVAITVAFVVDMARGQDGTPYGWLGAIAALAYLAAILAFRLRGRAQPRRAS